VLRTDILGLRTYFCFPLDLPNIAGVCQQDERYAVAQFAVIMAQGKAFSRRLAVNAEVARRTFRAAKETGRKCIAVEISPEYAELAAQAIKLN
jgi:hypothetical protein